MAWKRKQEDDGLDVITELKEPFSFAAFYEDHIIGRARKIKAFLEEKGILFFFLSPFQQRNRLILQLAIILFGVLAGVIPRGMHLLDETKARNAASEMAALLESGESFSVGGIRIQPLASSQYGRRHLLAFLITGANGTAPSTPERYKVELAEARGVMDMEHVSCSYGIVPISEEQRLLLVCADNRRQDDNTGIYNLYVELASDGLEKEERVPIEIVLSDTQETTELFGEGGIKLSTLTEGVLNSSSTPIADAEGKLSEALLAYELETERIANLPIDMAAVPTVSELKEYVEDNRAYHALSDASTTEDIASLAEIQNGDMATLAYEAAIEMGGKLYDEAYFNARTQETTDKKGKQKTGPLSEEEEAAAKELSSLQAKTDEVLHAAMALNAAASSKYKTLKNYKLTLNQEVDLSSFRPAFQEGEGTGAGESAPDGEAEGE